MRGATTGCLEAPHDNLKMTHLEPGNCSDISRNETETGRLLGAAYSIWLLAAANLDLFSHSAET